MAVNKRLLQGPIGGGALTPSENFKVVTWTGDGNDNRAIEVGFQPDMVWYKTRNQSNDHNLSDSTRGAAKQLRPNRDIAEVSATDQIKSFTATGFTVGTGGDANASGNTYVAWCWKSGGGTTSSNGDGSITSTVQTNTNAGFSIIQYTGTGSAATIGHGLGVAPDIIFSKRTSSSADWVVGVNDWTKYLELNGTPGFRTASSVWNNTAPTSTVFSVAGSGGSNGSGETNIAYAFKSIDGFSKIGTYTGNSSDNGPIVETGFEPAFLMIKNSSDAGSWFMYDNKRNTSNPRINYVLANASNVEASDMGGVDFLSNGFQIKEDHDDVNDTGDTYIYMAFAADPDTEAPTLASSFNIETWTGTGSARSITGLGFSPNLVWYKERSNTSGNELLDTIRGATNYISSNSSNAEASSAQGLQSFDSDGFSVGTDGAVNQSGETYVGWSWKADDNEPTILEQGANDSDTILTYRFEDDSTDDSTGTYNGTASNITFTSTGPLGNSVEFNGSSSQIVNSSFTRTQNYTVSLWLNTDTSSGERMAITLNWTVGPGRVGIGIKDGGIKYQDGNSGWLTILSSVSTDTWYHVAITYDHSSTTAKAYLNGSEVVSTSTTVTVPSTGSGLYLGQFGSGAGYWDGEISRVRIYDSALSSSDITTLYNESIKALVSANANAGFSIVKYTGSGADMKVPHGLSAAPDMLIVKGLETTNDWSVLHKDGSDGDFLQLNGSSAESGAGSIFGSTFTRPTATVFTVGNTGETGTADKKYIAYCFHDVAGYQKFGGYSGNGSGSGQTITTGFKVDWLMLKGITTGSEWVMVDSRRGDFYLLADTDGAEASYTAVDFLSTGFRLTSTGYNESGRDFIYWAVAKNVPSNTTLANSFKAVTYTGNGGTQSITGTGFTPDLVWIKHRNEANDHVLTDSIRGRGLIYPNGNDAQNQDSQVTSFDTDGFSLAYNTGQNVKFNKSGGTYVAWAWKAGNTWQSNIDGTIGSTVNANTANGFSIIKYTGTGSAASVGHNLSSTPDAILIKKTSGTEDWYYHSSTQLGSYNKNLRLNTTDAESTSSTIVTGASATVINLGTSSAVNGSGTDYIAYCWHSVTGYSKFGSYSGSGSDGNAVSLGFQPDFVMIKRTNSTGGWLIFDSARNTSNPRNNRLEANNNSAATTGSSTKNVDFNATDFEANGSDTEVNASGSTYIYMAFKMN